MSDQRHTMHTRVIHLDMGQVRDRDRDCRTIVASVSSLVACDVVRPPVPFEALFLAHYRSIREIARNDIPGAVVVVVHAPSGRLAGRVWIARRADRPNAGIIGRHSVCDLVLDDPNVSLRHLALIVPPRGEPEGCFTLHELRTPDGFYGELGQRMGGARVEGVGLFGIGAYALFTFSTGEPDRWPELAVDAWRDLAGAFSAVSVVRPLPRDQGPVPRVSSTLSVTAIRGPMHTNQMLMEIGEERVCALHVRSDGRRQRLALGEGALKRGVLLGRYPRCDSEGVLVSTEISRVHLLVLRVGEGIYGIDTASTHGVHTDAEATHPERVVAFTDGEIAILGDDVAEVTLRHRP